MPEPRLPGDIPTDRPMADRPPTASRGSWLRGRWSIRGKRPEPAEPPGDDTEAAVPTHIYCKRCGYDLSGTHDLVLCPECGKEFDFQQPKSFDRVPRREIRQRAARRVLLVLVLTGLVMAGLIHTVIPRPISRHHPTLWLWLNQPIGVQRSPLRGPTQYEMSWFFGEPRAVRVYDTGNPGRLLAEVRRPSMEADAFSLRVHGSGLRLESLLFAFNSLRTDDEVFGIQWMRDQPRTLSAGGFACDGTMAEVMASIVGHYGIRVHPLVLGSDDAMVNVFLPEGIALPDAAAAREVVRMRRALEEAGIIGPPGAGDLSALDRAYVEVDRALRAGPGPVVLDPIEGRVLRVSQEVAEALGYRVRQPDGPIILQRLDWYAARTGWY